MKMLKPALGSLFFVSVLSAAVVPKDLRVAIAQIKSVTLNPTSVVGGGTVSGTVTLAQAAGSNGVTVKFQSSKPAIAAVPANVVVQPGAASATFMVQTYPVAMNPNVAADPPSADISARGRVVSEDSHADAVVPCNSGIDSAVILSRADDEGSQVGTPVDLEILRCAQDDGLCWCHCNRYRTLVIGRDAR